MKKCLIFYNSQNSENLIILERVKRILEKSGIDVKELCISKDQCENIDVDFAVSIGGDGTVLYASHYLAYKDIPLIAIKAGGLGFLSSVEVNELENFINNYLGNNYKIINRTLLKIKIKDKEFVALNDCVIKSRDLRTFYTEIFFFNDRISTYFSDGIIISTPTGSTAYNLSAGGPIIHPHSAVMVITPISPHTLTHRPVVLPDKSYLKIKAYEKHSPKNTNIVVSLDGQITIDLADSELEISIYEKNLKTIVSKNYSYFEVLKKKLSWGERDD
ncbi:MAG: NAD(+)/NADH kinase [Elusimicrobiales bacterium]|jgi:NAD+ kinase|nr:NAD(+)/NADH kinase [Elusimicrobiales bacterium]NLH39662.1 NAD(+)/NADH kinase [Elusimicrobiota bacterium]